MTCRIPAALATLALVALVGCGSNDSTTGPDTAPPLAPQLLSGYSKTEGTVVLTWSPNVESDLAGYNIYEVGVTEPVATATSGSHAVALEAALTGSTPYRITAVDHSGNESAPSRILDVEFEALPVPQPDNIVDLRG